MIPFPSEEGGRCRACSCWLGVATGQGPPLQRAVRDVPPAQPFVPTRAHPEQGVQQCSDLNHQGFGAHQGSCNARVEATTPWAPVWLLPGGEAAPQRLRMGAEQRSHAQLVQVCLCLQAGVRQESWVETGRNCSCSTLSWGVRFHFQHLEPALGTSCLFYPGLCHNSGICLPE